MKFALTHCLLLGISFLLLPSCSPKSNSETETETKTESLRTGPKGLVQFRLPKNWVPAVGSMDTRFTPDSIGGSIVQIQVSEILIKKPRKLEKERDFWLENQKKNGSEILKSGLWESGVFSGVEYVHTGGNLNGKTISHAINIQSGNVLLATSLVGPKEAYETYLPIYLDVVKSIRLVTENQKLQEP